MNECLHRKFVIHAEVNRYGESHDEPAIGFSVQVQVICDECRNRFVFLTEGTIPGHDEPGAYVNPDGWAMEVPVAPGSTEH